MLFNSLDFALFFSVVFLLYWILFNNRPGSRNAFLLIVSYIFYGWWDWRFLILIVLSSFVDFVVGLRLHAETDNTRRKTFLLLSIVTNIGLLATFKYYNFFLDSFVQAFSLFGKHIASTSLNIVLPVGISFYTFQTLSYTIDVYRRQMEPTRNIVDFFAFVAFFPQLVAGPIERAKNLLPQFREYKAFDYDRVRSGFLLMAIGLFKKVVIADRLAIFVDSVYADVGAAEGGVMIIATIFFTFQLYIDFSAYSDIAIGVARTLGFDISTNFKRPYIADSFSDFWKRWHISLSSWFRDYVYIPLGGSRRGSAKTMLNVMIVFFLSGLWHGAAWKFVCWGALNGLFLILLDPMLHKLRAKHIAFRSVTTACVTTLWCLSLVFFRAGSFGDALVVFQDLSLHLGDSLYNYGLNKAEFSFSVCLIVGLIMCEIILEKSEKISQRGESLYRTFVASHAMIRWSAYIVTVMTIVLFGAYGIDVNDHRFIYFQF